MSPVIEKPVITQSDLMWGIAKGGVLIVVFTALMLLAWHASATLFLIFAGILLGVFLSAVSELLGRVMGGPYVARLVIVCLLLLSVLSGVVVLGGTTIAHQAVALSDTLRGQISNVKGFLDQRGIDTSFLDLGALAPSGPAAAPGSGEQRATPPKLPDAGALASGTGTIISQTLKVIAGAVGAVGNIFIVLFLGLSFASQPQIYRRGLLAFAPAKHRAITATIVDRVSEALQRWLVAQLIVMAAVFLATWIGLSIIGIPAAFILGIQAGLLAFIPTVGALIGGLIIVLASLGSGLVATASAFGLFLGVHALESYILTPQLQRQAIEIPPATLFALQILLGVIFGVWGLALALPLVAVIKVAMITLREQAGDDGVTA